MNKQQLIELIRVNLLYVNPQMTNKAREKGKKRKKSFTLFDVTVCAFWLSIFIDL